MNSCSPKLALLQRYTSGSSLQRPSGVVALLAELTIYSPELAAQEAYSCSNRPQTTSKVNPIKHLPPPPPPPTPPPTIGRRKRWRRKPHKALRQPEPRRHKTQHRQGRRRPRTPVDGPRAGRGMPCLRSERTRTRPAGESRT